jgi:16S rRNA (adenine1518-N6/adenine1519-N6)-dimethyltransferase
MLGPVEIQELLTKLDLRPTKKLGQNFVHDANTVRKIVKSAQLSAGDCVLEVGPGLGSLTLGLLPVVSKVIAVDIDQRLLDQLPITVNERAPEFLDRLVAIHADALELKSADLSIQPTALVANLPYNVSVPVILTLLSEFPTIKKLLVMVQSEVADRLAASPGTASYGAPSVKLQWFMDVQRLGSQC